MTSPTQMPGPGCTGSPPTWSASTAGTRPGSTGSGRPPWSSPRFLATRSGGAITSTAYLFGLATLELIGSHGLALAAAVLTWLSGLAAVWLLWRPASSAFFKSAKAVRSPPPSPGDGPGPT